MSNSVLVIGTGAQAKYAIETFGLLGIEVAGLLSLPSDSSLDRVGALSVLGTLEDFSRVWTELGKPGVLMASSRAAAKAAAEPVLRSAGAVFVSAIHPAAVIAKSASIGEGTIINAQAVIQPFARVGRHVMVHAGAIIEHDCVVGDFANLAPRACLAGHVSVGESATVFAGAVVLPTRRIGARAVVGAGAVVRQDVPDDTTVVGVPAKAIVRSGVNR